MGMIVTILIVLGLCMFMHKAMHGSGHGAHGSEGGGCCGGSHSAHDAEGRRETHFKEEGKHQVFPSEETKGALPEEERDGRA